ncbi:MAG: hypothetical protein HYV42_04620 [Candidatus Magasanikbacteria bacterium]|nr:hypothetical protein [Candidatus Magasanikbacteria bacterium]
MKIKDLPKVAKRLARQCASCSKAINIIVYRDHRYRGGHYFGKIPLHTEAEMRKAIRFGSHEVKYETMTLNVLNYEPKSYARLEYWECAECYRE